MKEKVEDLTRPYSSAHMAPASEFTKLWSGTREESLASTHESALIHVLTKQPKLPEDTYRDSSREIYLRERDLFQ